MKLINKKATHEYTILDRLEAGVALVGAEVKSIRTGHGKLDGAYVKIINNQPYLVNAEIPCYEYARPEGYDSKRTRKLLLHKREVLNLAGRMTSGGLTLVPLKWYTTGHLVKLEIGVARGKKEYEKREKLKREDMRRELEREYRGKIK